MDVSLLNDKNILVVEDNLDNQFYVSSILSDCGVIITSVYDGCKAIECLTKESYDVILMDLYMSGMNGIECVKCIRNVLDIKTPIIVMTAGLIDLHPDILEHIDGDIQKPYRPHELKNLIIKHLKKG